MSPAGIGLLTLLTLFGCTLFGILVHPLLPEPHRGKPTARSVKLGIGMVITVTSLVLSLLTFSVKNNFDTTETNVRGYATSLILLDRTLRAYGPDATPERDLLRSYTEQAIASTWPEEQAGDSERPLEDFRLGEMLSTLHDMIRRLDPPDAYHREMAGELLGHISDTVRRRFTLIEQTRHSIPPLMLWGVISWLAVIFLSFGLNAPRNPVVLLTMALCALAISSAIYLVDEMDTPFDGIIKISSQSMRDALEHERRPDG